MVAQNCQDKFLPKFSMEHESPRQIYEISINIFESLYYDFFLASCLLSVLPRASDRHVKIKGLLRCFFSHSLTLAFHSSSSGQHLLV